MSRLSRHARPVLVQDGSPAVALQRVELGGGNDGDRREAFVQALVHDNPDVIPMVDTEPAFTPLFSACTELPTSAGYLDNLWVTPDGALVLGECKLMRNPRARREVVVQALDYACAINGWHYADLKAGFQKAQRKTAATLWEIVRDQTDLEEAQFIDSVEREDLHQRHHPSGEGPPRPTVQADRHRPMVANRPVVKMVKTTLQYGSGGWSGWRR